ncbi:MAG: Gfo/Idh/MocA family oxidoreductase [Chloroflexota bacterium]
MKKVGWGLLSTARINRRVIPAIRMSPRGELVAVASRTAVSATAYAKEWEIPQTFASYEAMLQSDAVDAVYISLPNTLHAEWTAYALRHGKHVLCEKPFATTLAEVDQMTAVAAETGNVLAEAFMYRHHPQTKLVGEWVQNGRLGDVTLVRAVFNFQMGSRQNIRLRPGLGGGSLWDVGIYPVSFAQCVIGGPPTAVFGDQWLGPSGVDEEFAGQMRYTNGAMAQISSSFRTPYFTYAEVQGTNGRLVLTRPFNALDAPDRRLLYFPPGQDTPEEIPVPDEYLYLGEVEDMHDAILHGQPSYLTLSETRNHVKTVLALYQSAQAGQRVDL